MTEVINQKKMSSITVKAVLCFITRLKTRKRSNKMPAKTPTKAAAKKETA